MQFNFLGGNTQRDTLQNALGQRNQVLESQLDFSKSAFTTGVQGVGNTMREAMRLGQAETEAVRRDKTTIREGMISRQKDQDLLSQRLEADKLAYERSLTDQDTRTKDARQKRLDDEAAARENANLDQAARERRDREEFERRRKLGLDDREAARKQADAKNKGRVTGAQARFDALKPQIKDPAILKSVESAFNTLKTKLDETTDPDEREGLLASLEDLLKPETLVRMIRGAAKEKEAEPASSSATSSTGNTGRAPTPRNTLAPAAPAAAPTAAPAASEPTSAVQTQYSSMPDPSAGGYPIEQRNLLGQRLEERYDLRDYMDNILRREIPNTPIVR